MTMGCKTCDYKDSDDVEKHIKCIREGHDTCVNIKNDNGKKKRNNAKGDVRIVERSIRVLRKV